MISFTELESLKGKTKTLVDYLDIIHEKMDNIPYYVWFRKESGRKESQRKES
jgi:hypothetical protein